MGSRRSCQPHIASPPLPTGLFYCRDQKITFPFKTCHHTRAACSAAYQEMLWQRKKNIYAWLQNSSLFLARRLPCGPLPLFCLFAALPAVLTPQTSRSSSIFSLTQPTFVPMTRWLWGEITHEVHFVKNRIPSTIQLRVQISGCIFNSWELGHCSYFFYPKKPRSNSASCRRKPGLVPNSPHIPGMLPTPPGWTSMPKMLMDSSCDPKKAVVVVMLVGCPDPLPILGGRSQQWVRDSCPSLLALHRVYRRALINLGSGRTGAKIGPGVAAESAQSLR